MKEILYYIVHPYYEIKKTKTLKETLTVFSLIFFINLIVSYVYSKLILQTGLGETFFENDENFEASDYALLQIIILGIAEELIFRAPLKYKSYILPLFTFFLFVFLFGVLRQVFGFENISIKILVFVIPLLIAMPFFFFLRKKDKINDKLNLFWKEKFKYIFYGSAVLFALVHAVELNVASIIGFLVALLFVIPHFISGLLFGFARMKIALWAAILIHVFYNIGIDYVWDFFEYLFSLF